ncbi:Uv-b-induced protein [Thalictrum thalictroides]|uniref:Uv-b-induced protein n=1 Tax=Thalictrum thalictroides TaxID=46969 RepID=A0A7J6WNR8_THATH|nr:Uv-b-induced protein [Thalictrum thalictroides]
MDCCKSIKKTPIVEALPIVVKTQRRGIQVSLAKVGFSSSSRKFFSTLQSQSIVKVSGTPQSGENISSRRRNQPIIAQTDTESRAHKYSGVGTPLEPKSPEGKFLSGILQNQRHLFHFAVSEQLDVLASQKNEALSHKKHIPGSIASLLHRRIAELKEKECQIAVEDVMYMSIVQKFSEIEVPMVPKLSSCVSNNKLEIWPSKCRDLESIHSFEVQKLIKEHIDTILRLRGKSSGKSGPTTTKIDRLHIGRIYAASILLGYFLKSACYRHHLESGLARSQDNFQPLGHDTYLPVAEIYPSGFRSLLTLDESTETQLTSLCQESLKCEMRHERLSSYVKGFDSETLQRCAKLKSKEAVNVIEKHTWALVGDEKIGEHDCDNDIVTTFPSLERLVMEAVTFGSFLWDVERLVDSKYELMEN